MRTRGVRIDLVAFNDQFDESSEDVLTKVRWISAISEIPGGGGGIAECPLEYF
jgi:hypothetical protein